MTESEWNTCDYAAPMLDFLRDRVSQRKAWLLLCGFSRVLGGRATVALSRAQVGQLESCADGQLAARDLSVGWPDVHGVRQANPWFRMWTMARDQTRKRRYRRMLVAVIRDIFGSLLWRSVASPPAWLAWNDGTIHKMAQAIYDARSFDRLPLLADALEDAGCSDADILAHCRGPGPHVRGCWVVDLLLGKS